MARALVIDDDPDAGELLCALLAELGWSAAHALTGEEGLLQIRDSDIELLFLDVMLPDIDGYQVCQELKLNRKTNALPVIMVSALSASQSRLRGLNVGADVYVGKPYLPAEIDRAIEQALLARDRRREQKIEISIRCDFASQQENLNEFNDLLGVILQHTPLTDKQANQFRTALLEVGQNAIEWGNRHDPTKVVSIRADVTPDRIQIDVEDEGEGFNPKEVPHAADEESDPTAHFAVRELLGIREGGFGIQIVRGMMDEVRYNKRGNCVTLVKYLTDSPGPTPAGDRS